MNVGLKSKSSQWLFCNKFVASNTDHTTKIFIDTVAQIVQKFIQLIFSYIQQIFNFCHPIFIFIQPFSGHFLIIMQAIFIFMQQNHSW